MPATHSNEIIESAEELYVLDGKTYEETAQIVGVSLSAVKRWGKDGGWADRRREYRKALGSIRRDTVLLRHKLIKNALDSLDPQAVYAAARLEQVQKASARPDEPRTSVPVREIASPEQAADALMEAIEKKLNMALAHPETLDFSTVKNIQASLEFVEKLRSKKADDKIDLPALMDQIRERVYGL